MLVNDPPTVADQTFELSQNAQGLFTIQAFDVEGDSMNLEILEYLGAGAIVSTGLLYAMFQFRVLLEKKQSCFPYLMKTIFLPSFLLLW